MSDVKTVPEVAARLNQPWRGWIAIGEVVLAAVAVLVGIKLWGVGVTTTVTPLGNGQPPLVATIFYGNWLAYGIGLVVVAATLLLDAIRELSLAVRTRRRQLPPEATAVVPPTE